MPSFLISLPPSLSLLKCSPQPISLCCPCVYRQVNLLAANWDALRQGSTTFDALRRSASAGSSGAAATAARAQPQRRRLVRAAELGGGGSGQAGGGDGVEVVDLLDSPSPGRAPAAGDADEALAWQALQDALSPQQQQRQRRSGSRCAGGAVCCALGAWLKESA